MDYFTKWIEALPSRKSIDLIVIQILENILSRFGSPKLIITDNAQYFKSKRLIKLCDEYHIKIGHSTSYYP